MPVSLLDCCIVTKAPGCDEEVEIWRDGFGIDER